MTSTAPAADDESSRETTLEQPRTRDLIRSGLRAGAIAAVGTGVVAAIANAADVALEVDGEPIPIPAFVWWTLVGSALGVLLARLLRERRRFVIATTVATGLSLVPALIAPDDSATTAVLAGTHLLAAAIIIPTLSRRLPTSGPTILPAKRATPRPVRERVSTDPPR